MITVTDQRSSPVVELPERLAQALGDASEALLWTAKRPKKNWHQAFSSMKAHVLASSAQFEQIFWVTPELTLSASPQLQEEHDYLLKGYKELFKGEARANDCPSWKRYESALRSHITRQDSVTYPAILQALPLERSLRELGYEHRGLEKGLERLPDILNSARKGELSPKEREMFDLDFYHLLEHHLEREMNAVYPTMSFLERVDRAKASCYNSSHRDNPT